MENITVLIGIQARTNSTRLPNKAMKKIMGIPTVDHVVNAALKSSQYMNRFSERTGIRSLVWALIPEGDPLKEYLEGRPGLYVHSGDPDDLVERYSFLVEEFNPDYIVRLTADCPLLPPFLITKCINTAVKNKYDFLDTAHPEYRCFFDGADVEVMSSKAFEWVYKNATDREHVCNILRSDPPEWMNMGAIFSYLDLSAFKLSIDTQKDFDLVKNQIVSVQNKKRKWEEKHGKSSAHSF